jgi:hypothetical protein
MKRTAGVTAIAILSLLGSACTFALGILMLAVMVIAPVSRTSQFPGSPTSYKIMLGIASLMYLLPAVWGIVIGIGLWRLKGWARISIIIFAALLTLMGGFTGLTILVIPMPVPANGAADPAVMRGVRAVMAGFCLTLLGIGVWWLVFFNRARVKQQFIRIPSTATVDLLQPSASQPGVEGSTASETKRPLSITIVAWLLLIGCAFILLSLFMHAPIILFTKLLTGWPAIVLFVAFAAAQLWIGIGLLQLRPAARTAAMVFLVFGYLNSAVFYLAPGAHDRMLLLMASERNMFPWMRAFQPQPELQFDITPFFMIGAVAGLVGMAVPLYFLMTRRFAFERAAIGVRPN